MGAVLELLQCSDCRKRGVSGGNLVIDKHDGSRLSEKVRAAGLQCVVGGVRVTLLKLGVDHIWRCVTSGGVQVHGRVEVVGDAVTETGRSFGHAQHVDIPEAQAGNGTPELVAASNHVTRVGGDVFAEHRRHQQVRSPGVASQSGGD